MIGRRQLLVLGLFVLVLLAISSLTHAEALALRSETPEIDRHVEVPAPRVARLLSMGYTEMAADIAWVRMLVYYGDGVIHDTGMPDTEALVRLVNTLDPQFRKAYFWGAYATTMRIGMATDTEYHSSVEILRRALEVFPDDWEFNWILGIRLFIEIKGGTEEDFRKRKEEGVAYIERAMHCPKAPGDLPTLAASLRTQLGQKEQALRGLREMILSTPDEKARAVLVDRYSMLASETASHELANAAQAFDKQWKATLPYANPEFYVLLGPPPSEGIDLDAVLTGETIDIGPALAPQDEQ